MYVLLIRAECKAVTQQVFCTEDFVPPPGKEVTRRTDSDHLLSHTLLRKNGEKHSFKPFKSIFSAGVYNNWVEREIRGLQYFFGTGSVHNSYVASLSVLFLSHGSQSTLLELFSKPGNMQDEFRGFRGENVTALLCIVRRKPDTGVLSSR